MRTAYNALIFSASYGSLFATKFLLAGHAVKLVCLPDEASLINNEGTRVRLPLRGRGEVVEIHCELCWILGASEGDLVPFDKYATVARQLTKSSSAARALVAGATNIERVDRLVRNIGAQQGMRSDAVDEIVGLVDAWLAANRKES